MLRKIAIVFLLLFQNSLCKGQSSLINAWNKTYGGTMIDVATNFIQTCDKGFLVFGSSCSPVSGDINLPRVCPGLDTWILKLDSLGNIQWQKRYGGIGSSQSVLKTGVELFEGGFILGGYTNSQVGNDVSQSNRDTSGFTVDAWIVRIDENGNILWDKKYGGNKSDEVGQIIRLSNGDYILGCSSCSSTGGEKSSPNFDTSLVTSDVWIIRIDSVGNKIWDKTIGGSEGDNFWSIIKTLDEKILVSFYSYSPADGNISIPRRDSLPYCDVLLSKLNLDGDIIWMKRYGGSLSDLGGYVLECKDSGFAICAYSYSPISGEKTLQNHGPNPTQTADTWFLRTDSEGNILWQKVYGSDGEENGRVQFIITHDNCFVLTTNTFGLGISGDKTQSNLSTEQTWIIKIDSLGNKIWDKTIQQANTIGFGYADPAIGTIEAFDGGFVSVNFTDATNIPPLFNFFSRRITPMFFGFTGLT